MWFIYWGPDKAPTWKTDILRGGYSLSDLFVDKRYSSLKEEILNYPLLEISVFNDQIKSKADQYAKSETFKAAKASLLLAPYDFYGIEYESSLGYDNLLCVFMYTDLTELSCEFTSTFRKRDPFESLTSIKTRNSKYWHWSKTLRETVECYGIQRYTKEQLKGPFYTGLSSIITMPQFQLRLFSPTSTSVHLEVAVKFGGDHGIIMEMKNNTGEPRYLSGFDCSVYSQYGEEDERYEYCHIFILYIVKLFCVSHLQTDSLWVVIIRLI